MARPASASKHCSCLLPLARLPNLCSGVDACTQRVATGKYDQTTSAHVVVDLHHEAHMRLGREECVVPGAWLSAWRVARRERGVVRGASGVGSVWRWSGLGACWPGRRLRVCVPRVLA